MQSMTSPDGIVCINQNIRPITPTHLWWSLSIEEVINNIIMVPQISSNYKLDDGHTKLFIDSLLVNDWTVRPTINIAINRFINKILSSVY